MPRISLNQEICEAIKKMRKSSGETASDVAKHLRKSTGFISSIENGKVETVDLKDIYFLIDHLAENDPEAKGVMIQLLNDSTINYTSKELEQRFSLIAFDLQYREISISEDYIDFVHSELNDNNLTSVQVMTELNSNKYVGVKDLSKFPKNKLIFSSNLESSFIRFELTEDFLDKILSRKKTTANYITHEGILYAINLLKGHTPELSSIKAHEALKQLKIYTLSERRKTMEDEDVRGIVLDITPQFDMTNTKLPEDIIKYLQAMKSVIDDLEFLKERNIDYTTGKLETLHEGLSLPETVSITLAFLGLPLSQLKHLSQGKQRELFEDVKNLLQKYIKEKPDKVAKIVEFD